MSLKSQLLTFAALTLVLPWAGYRYVQEMEAALRSGLEQALLASAGTVAAALDEQLPLLKVAAPRNDSRRQGDTVYGAPLAFPPNIDGVRDDWEVEDGAALLLEGGHRVWAGVHDRYAYLFIAARDDDLVYQGSPGETPYGDRLLLVMEPRSGSREWLLLATRAPGAFRGQRTAPPLFARSARYDDRITSAWQERPGGFAVELRVPLNLVGEALGVAVIDVDVAARAADGSASSYEVAVGSTWDIENEAPGKFVFQQAQLQQFVRQFSQAGDRFRVVDREGWVLSDTGWTGDPMSASASAASGDPGRSSQPGQFDEPGQPGQPGQSGESGESGQFGQPAASASGAGGLAGDLFRLLLRRDDPEYGALERPPGRLADDTLREALTGAFRTAWYRGGPDQNATVVAAAPIRDADGVLGAVLLEQASDPILTLTNQALMRLMTSTLLATFLVTAGLFGYATLLSFRVRRLARAAETALGPKGEIDVHLPGAKAGDELGDLTRSFGDLLERLREHTQYLRTLTSKLSHELRTPLAVVSTSLDNLEHEANVAPALPYLERIRQGAQRLDTILVAMSEATRMEQAIGETVPERFDLAAVVESCCRAYSDIYPERQFDCRVEAQAAQILGSGELVAQLIDKLVDNAVGFSPTGSVIEVALTESEDEIVLSVANRGPLLPAAMRQQLFDSLVSVRATSDDGRPHLGLGLYIVALIAQFHHGRVTADNLPDDSGVIFRVWFPRGGRGGH